MVNFVHNWWVYGLPNGVARYGCYWITLHVWIKPILYFFSFVQTIFVARRSEPVSCLFCNIDIDIQNSHILTEIRFPRPIVFRWCITPYCLPLKAPSLTGTCLALLFSIRVERAWWNIGAKHHEIQKLMKFWSRKQAIIIEQIDS